MKKYELTGDYPLLHGGKEYQPGDTVEMDEAAAASKVESGRLVAADAGDGSEDTLLGSSKLPAEIEIGEGVKVSLDDLVKFAFTGLGADAETWNKLPEEDREAMLERCVELLKSTHAASVANNGKAPTVSELKKLTGFDLDAKTKDAAWAFLEGLQGDGDEK